MELNKMQYYLWKQLKTYHFGKVPSLSDKLKVLNLVC